ncbi:MAG TPA: hypothetical protein PKX91_04670 [Clostridia bacterium]|jgi:hypothetical protein|nr:hypothetical protein [Clostridia bacterium]
MVFASRKNNVVLNKDSNIEKTFSNKEALKTEVSMLKKLQGEFAPSFINQLSDNCIEMSYVKGTLLLDYYLSSDTEVSKKLAESLANTIFYIHSTTKKITFDENFRNYIVTPDFKCVRVDFEECTAGTLECYIAKIMAFASLYEVEKHIKVDFITSLCSFLKPNFKDLICEYETELKFLSNRWGVNFPTPLFETIRSLLTSFSS